MRKKGKGRKVGAGRRRRNKQLRKREKGGNEGRGNRGKEVRE